MSKQNFKENELIIYQNGDRFEIGRIKRLTEDGAFVYYHSGDTAAKTPFDCMHKLANSYCIERTILGGEPPMQYVIKHTKNPDLKELLKSLNGPGFIMPAEHDFSIVPLNKWIPINPDDESTFPKDDSFILLSFTNYPICAVGQYRTDKEGGAFYLASNFKSCLEHGFIVNAWQPLPEPYKDEQCSK